MSSIRIESHQDVVTDAKIIYVPTEGDEVDISSCVTAVDISLRHGAIARADLYVILRGTEVTAELDRLIVEHDGRRWYDRLLGRTGRA